jgi:hypothetical protein
VVDDNEKRVLGSIISRLNSDELQGELEQRVNQLREEYRF